jgi:sulfite reductase beta subunit-like hemoprotein
MSQTLLLTATPVLTPKKTRPIRRKRPFDQRAKSDLRRLLAALRDLGDRPNLAQIRQRYEISEAKLKTFLKEVEAEALVIESCCK